MTNRTPARLVCVYYRVAAPDAARVIAGVREFQRTLRLEAGVVEAEVLLRCNPRPDSPAADVRQASRPPSEPLAGQPMPAEHEVDATVMETYRLALPDADGPRAFLASLAAAATPLAGLVLGERHVEVFAPCVS